MQAQSMKQLGQRIAELRKKLGLTQADLAIHLGVGSPQIISQIELGQRDIKAWELAELSKALLVNVTELLLPQDHKRVEQPVLWRAVPKSGQGEKEARFLKHCRDYATLEELSGVGRPREFPQKMISLHTIDFQDANRLAEQVRGEFELGARPAASLERTLEDRYGVKVWYDDLDEGSAAATIGDFGPAILMNRREAPWRRNYNFAHELFHLITWKSIPAEKLQNNPPIWEKIEKLANFFASCLLLPADAVRIELYERTADNQIEYNDLIAIAREFDVSTEALLYRVLTLSLLNKDAIESILGDADFRSLDRATMSASWWDPPDLPERFVRLASVAYKKGRLSRARLAELLDCSLPDVTETLSEYGLDDREIDKKLDLRAA